MGNRRFSLRKAPPNLIRGPIQLELGFRAFDIRGMGYGLKCRWGGPTGVFYRNLLWNILKFQDRVSTNIEGL